MKKLILILSLVLSAGFAYSQSGSGETSGPSGKKFDPSRVVVGGNLQLQFGDYYTVIGISPQVGYAFSKYLTAGAGAGYTYFRQKEFDYTWSRNYFTLDLFGRVYPVDFLVLSVQPEASRMWQTVKYLGGKDQISEFVPSLLVGGGVRYMGVLAMIQYDVVQNKYSPYGANMFYSLGYAFNF